MPNKKSAESNISPEEQELEQRVEIIMNPDKPDSTQTPKKTPDERTTPAIDIFSDPKTAPAVPKELLKNIGVEAAKKPADTIETPTVTNKAKTRDAVEAAIVRDGAAATIAIALDDATTDKAVDEIVSKESDELLAAEDAAATQTVSRSARHPWKAKAGRFFKNKWTWILLLAALFILFGVPITRYKLVGLVLKESVNVTVIDSKTNTPVSSAMVSLDGVSAKTDANGKATLKVPPGTGALRVTKQYYRSYAASYFVGFSSGARTSVRLLATGRQVPVTVLNTITGQPLANAQVAILDTTAKTNARGQAIIVLPTTGLSDSASVSLTGYNTTQASIQVTSSIVSNNTVHLTPSGYVYFLSNQSGTIDVVKTNLDGSGRQTVLAGTGKEDPNSTSLLASRDWRYLVLKSQRDTPQPALYIIDTSDDKVTEFDNGDANFTLIGWYGHDFMYDVVRNNVAQSQSGHEAIKSYNADTGQLNQLDQNQEQGAPAAYAYQGFYNFYILNNELVYNTQWYTFSSNGTNYDLSSLSDTIRAVQPAGQNKKDYQSIPAAGLGYIQAALYEPQSLYYAVYSYATNATTYYAFDGQTVTNPTGLSQTTFSQSYPTYLLSPSGAQTFWTELLDGKNTLFIGGTNADGKKQIATNSDYSPYGWYSDEYVLVTKSNSELYIMPAAGLQSGQQPLKIANYYRPTQSYNGYGYGYGGL